MTKEETLPDGRRIERDEFGRFKRAELDSEQARYMGKRSGEARRGTSARELVEEAGYIYSYAPHYVILMAQQAVKSPTAMRDWRGFVGYKDRDEYTGREDSMQKPEAGELCPLCGQTFGTIWDKLGWIGDE